MHKPHKNAWIAGDGKVRYDRSGHAVIEATLTAPGTVIVFFGTE